MHSASSAFQSINQSLFYRAPTVDQRAGQLSLSASTIGIAETERNRTKTKVKKIYMFF